MSSEVIEMTESEKRDLVIEHARLVSALAAGNQEVKPRLSQIESTLNMSATQIAYEAVAHYLKDY